MLIDRRTAVVTLVVMLITAGLSAYLDSILPVNPAHPHNPLYEAVFFGLLAGWGFLLMSYLDRRRKGRE